MKSEQTIIASEVASAAVEASEGALLQNPPTAAETADGQVPFAIIRPHPKGIRIDWTELWNYRELLYFFVWRDILIRYKQTVLGAIWEIIKPLSMMVIYTICLGYVLRVSSDGIPYPLFFYSGVLLWGFCAQAMNSAALSVVGASNLVTKIYFPRILIPLGIVLSTLVDLALASVVLLLLMVCYKVYPTVNILLVPLAVLVALLTALGMGLFFAAVTVRYRDFQNVIGLLTTLWMFLTPVFYPASLIPKEWKFLYSLNPMTGAVEAFRWAVLGKSDLILPLLLPGVITAVAIFVIGLVYFEMREKSFSDWL